MNHIKIIFTALILVSNSLIADTNNAVLEQSFAQIAQEPSSVSFNPPKGWGLVDHKQLPASILAMVVGKGDYEFPPSINLGVHNNSGTLKQFLKFVRETNQADGIEWKDLGTIRTQAGDASLSQLDTRTEWGNIREMQVIFVKDNTAYILTAAALKQEFSKFYKDFFSSMRSLKINKSIYEMIPDSRRRNNLKEASAQVIASWKKELATNPSLTFENETFQTKVWEPFKQRLQRDFSDMKSDWHSYFLESLKKEIQQ